MAAAFRFLAATLWLVGEPLAIAVLTPQYARVEEDIETVWQRPPGESKGVVFIAHGCQHQGTDIFSDVGPDGWVFEACKRSNLGRCLGLPEEMHLRRIARQRGYLVMAVSGGTGKRSCWDMRRDVARVRTAIDYVKEREQLADDAPVIAIGASSGGAFVGRLAAPVEDGGVPHLRCIVPQIMNVGGAPNRGVPVLFVHMPRDTRTDALVQSELAYLRSQNVRAAEIRVGPVPIGVEFLAPCLDAELGQQVVEVLHRDGTVDAEGFLTSDGRARRWVPAFAEVLAGRPGFADMGWAQPDASCVAELMNVAWAKHEFTSQHSEQMLDFCEGVSLMKAPARGEF